MAMQGTAADLALAEALRSLDRDPGRAEALCRALLQADAEHGDARLVLCEVLRRKGALVEARGLARIEVQRRPQWFGAHRQLGLVLRDEGEPLPAAMALRQAAELNPAHPTIWREVGDQLTLAGDVAGAQAAYARHGISGLDPQIERAARALRDNDVATAEPILIEFLARVPTDVTALRLLSEAQARAGRSAEAERTLRRCLELAPTFVRARHGLGQLLRGLGRLDEAAAEARTILLHSPDNRGARRLMAAICDARGDYDEALGIYERLLTEEPRQPMIWMSYGHILKTVGRTREGIEAYRKSIAQSPGLGESYWSLANLKTFRFSDEEIARMRAQLERADLADGDRVGLFYALGKAREDAGDAAEAFALYSQGAALRRAGAPHLAERTAQFVAESCALFTTEFFAARAGAGAAARDPILVVGLPRSGSTLIEQILASHSQVEGTMELPDLATCGQSLIPAAEAEAGGFYLEALARTDAAALTELGETYMRRTRVYRKLDRPFFIDKMPNNWAHVGLAQLILPNARIVDVRRHPMACGWSCFKQHFAMGQNFTYDLTDIGRFYVDYVKMMAHVDEVLPGRVHRVIYEELVADPEPQIRALLEYCGLPFEPQCLAPHETARAVKTASSEQVRRPISAQGLDDWRKFEPWLDPLKQALGPVLDAYPDAPR